MTTSSFTSVGVFANQSTPLIQESLQRVVALLNARGVRVMVEETADEGLDPVQQAILWEACDPGVVTPPGAPGFVHQSAAYQAAPEAAGRLAAGYARWVTNLEDFYCKFYAIPHGKRRRRKRTGPGRGHQWSHAQEGKLGTRRPSSCFLAPISASAPIARPRC